MPPAACFFKGRLASPIDEANTKQKTQILEMTDAVQIVLITNAATIIITIINTLLTKNSSNKIDNIQEKINEKKLGNTEEKL